MGRNAGGVRDNGRGDSAEKKSARQFIASGIDKAKKSFAEREAVRKKGWLDPERREAERKAESAWVRDVTRLQNTMTDAEARVFIAQRDLEKNREEARLSRKQAEDYTQMAREARRSGSLVDEKRFRSAAARWNADARRYEGAMKVNESTIKNGVAAGARKIPSVGSYYSKYIDLSF